jgi:hypothetical protein
MDKPSQIPSVTLSFPDGQHVDLVRLHRGWHWGKFASSDDFANGPYDSLAAAATAVLAALGHSPGVFGAGVPLVMIVPLSNDVTAYSLQGGPHGPAVRLVDHAGQSGPIGLSVHGAALERLSDCLTAALEVR